MTTTPPRAYTASDGPQSTAADAYTTAAAMAFAVVEKAIRPSDSFQAWVRVEYVEHLAAQLAEKAEEAGR